MEDVYTYLNNPRVAEKILYHADTDIYQAKKIVWLYRYHKENPYGPFASDLREYVTDYIRWRKNKIGAWPAEAPFSLRTEGPNQPPFKSLMAFFRPGE